jgi:hypothetical protein
MTDADRELERLFAVTRSATEPDAGARARVRAGLAARLAGSPAASLAERTASKGAWLSLGAAVVGIGAFLLLAAPEEEAVVPKPALSSAAAPAPSLERVASAQARQPAPPVASEVAVAPQPSSSSRGASRRSAAPGPSPTDRGDEIALVTSMQQALRAGQASQVLALASEHARRFPSGAMAQEREGARAIALCQLSAPPERRAIFDDFSKRFASSPYTARAKAACQ